MGPFYYVVYVCKIYHGVEYRRRATLLTNYGGNGRVD